MLYVLNLADPLRYAQNSTIESRFAQNFLSNETSGQSKSAKGRIWPGRFSLIHDYRSEQIHAFGRSGAEPVFTGRPQGLKANTRAEGWSR